VHAAGKGGSEGVMLVGFGETCAAGWGAGLCVRVLWLCTRTIYACSRAGRQRGHGASWLWGEVCNGLGKGVRVCTLFLASLSLPTRRQSAPTKNCTWCAFWAAPASQPSLYAVRLKF